jgi:CubicO group peptidase (beta-lactamase class C family)
MLRLIPATFACLLIGPGLAQGFSWDASREQQALQLVRNFQVLHSVPSVALAITVDGKVVLARGIDATGKTVPGGEEIRYRIGSVTKQFTAAGVLALIEDKAMVPSINVPISVDTDLSEIFPGDVDRDSGIGKVTVRRLLTMTSNIPSYTDDAAVLSVDQTGAAPAARALDAFQIIQLLKTYRLAGPPLAFEYSNTNYFVLSLIIHVLEGGGRLPTPAFEQSYIHQRILDKAE